MQAFSTTVAALRPVAAARHQRSAGPSARPMCQPLRSASSASRRVAAAASSKPADFDEFLSMVAEKFEKVDNKPVVVGYLVGAFFAITTAEWLINLPLLNVLVGWPIQFLGLVLTPYLALRYFVNKDGEILDDAEWLVGKYTKELPGLGKK